MDPSRTGRGVTLSFTADRVFWVPPGMGPIARGTRRNAKRGSVRHPESGPLSASGGSRRCLPRPNPRERHSGADSAGKGRSYRRWGYKVLYRLRDLTTMGGVSTNQRANAASSTRTRYAKTAIKERERAAAKERQGTRTDKHSAKLAPSSAGKSRTKVAKAAGTSAPTFTAA